MSDSKTIVLTRDNTGNAAWSARLESLGLNVYSLPTIETISLDLEVGQKDVLKNLSGFDWLVFTSMKAVQYFVSTLSLLDITWPHDKPSVTAIGPQTAHTIEKHGIPVTFMPSQANNATLGNELIPVEGKTILLPHSDIATNDLAVLLTKRGGKVTSLPIYTTRLVEKSDEAFLGKLAEGSVQCLVFASPSAVRGFCLQIAGTALLWEAKAIPAIAIGPSTTSALANAGFISIYTSRTPTLDGIIEVLQQLIR